MNKRILGILICMLLIGTCFVITVSAEQEGDYTYTVSNGKATITKYTGAGGAVTIPSTLGGYPTTQIGDRAFYGCSTLISVTIPNSVTTIGISAFSRCYKLVSVTIPNSVNTIGNASFYQCGITSITIPKSVTTIGKNVFIYCGSLTSINIDAANINYASVDGVFYNKAITILIKCPDGKIGTYTIPSSVITIEDNAFQPCCLTSVVIGNGVTTIGNNVFSYSNNLTSVTIGSSITTIGSEAFSDCGHLISIKFLGLVAPTSVYYTWITRTSAEIRGHAYANSNFPAPGDNWNGLTMGAVIGDENEEPVASFTWTPSSPKANQTVTFDASASSDPDGSITKYEWDWNNDGTYDDSKTTPTVTYSWPQAGSYPVKLQVTDNEGAKNTKTLTISVSSRGGDGGTEDKGTPGFELIILLCAIVISIILLKKKRNT